MMVNRSDRGTSRHIEVNTSIFDALVMANRHITSAVTAQYNMDNYYADGSSGDNGDEDVSFQLGNNNGSGREEEGMHERQQSQSDRQ
jgi:hypothetical protein